MVESFLPLRKDHYCQPFSGALFIRKGETQTVIMMSLLCSQVLRDAVMSKGPHSPFQGCTQHSERQVGLALWRPRMVSELPAPSGTGLFAQLFTLKAFRCMPKFQLLLGGFCLFYSVKFSIWLLVWIILVTQNLILLALELPPKIAQGFFFVFFFLAHKPAKFPSHSWVSAEYLSISSLHI